MDDLTLSWGFLVFLVLGGLGVFLQRGAPYILPRRVLAWPVLSTLNRLLPGALILLFFLVTFVVDGKDGVLKPWVLGVEVGILLLAVGVHLLLRQVLVTIVFAVALHYVVFYHAVGWFLQAAYNWSP
jgi:branched-subunit amino acid transport protein AzlD